MSTEQRYFLEVRYYKEALMALRDKYERRRRQADRAADHSDKATAVASHGTAAHVYGKVLADLRRINRTVQKIQSTEAK